VSGGKAARVPARAAAAAARTDAGAPAPAPTGAAAPLAAIAAEIVACERCPRLRAHCSAVAAEKRRAYRDWDYWGRPVPGFGDPAARLLVVGLAPAAHGGNRTGRVFTGDSSGDWLYAAMHEAGFANQPTSVSREDGLVLLGAYVTAAARCAPPGNRPTTEELNACRPFLVREMEALRGVRAVVALGGIALDAVVRAFIARGLAAPRPRPRFAHGALWDPGPGWPLVLCSYHPSRQNTNTGRLTKEMWREIFRRAAELVGRDEPARETRGPAAAEQARGS